MSTRTNDPVTAESTFEKRLVTGWRLVYGNFGLYGTLLLTASSALMAFGYEKTAQFYAGLACTTVGLAISLYIAPRYANLMDDRRKVLAQAGRQQ